DQHAVIAANVVDDRLVELVAADAHRTLVDETAERDHAYFGCAAADVHHHRAGGFAHRKVGADRSGHRLLDQVDVGCARADGGLADRAPLDLCGAAGHADDDARGRLEEA